MSIEHRNLTDSRSTISPIFSPIENRVNIPDSWITTIHTVNETAREIGISYAEVGSLSLAIMHNDSWSPTKTISHGRTDTRDLDLFLIGTDEARNKFRSQLSERLALLKTPTAKIDIVSWYDDKIHFDNSGIPHLTYKEIDLPLDYTLFATYPIRYGDMTLLVLHPRTLMHMTGIAMRLLDNPKAINNMLKLNRVLRSNDKFQFPELAEKSFDSFHQFKKDAVNKYFLQYLAWFARRKLYWAEESNNENIMIKFKAWIRHNHPEILDYLRDLVD